LLNSLYPLLFINTHIKTHNTNLSIYLFPYISPHPHKHINT
jgi:hypothetical protein